MARRRIGLISLSVVVLLSGCRRRRPETARTRTDERGAEYFEKKVRPILVRYCYECHSGDPRKAKSNFVLDTREGLRKGGQSGR